MANKSVFKGATAGTIADTVNHAGGIAYSLSNEAALATLACTGTIHNTFYVDAKDQFEEVLKLCQACSPKFIAKTAIYSRQKAYMKDMPCLLLAILLTKDTALFKKVFPKVIDNAKMLRSFVQILRAGVVGRKSFGTVVAKCVQRWFDGWNDPDRLFNSSVGGNPSLGDIIRLGHVKPKDETFSALFAYLCGFPHDSSKLPDNVKRYELLKSSYAEGIEWDELPNINFQYLTSVKLSDKNWMDIARNASWQTARMNLNTFQRHNVFEDKAMIKYIADVLTDGEQIAKSKVFPYTLLMAYKAATGVPFDIKEALQDAMEKAVSNCPKIKGKVIVAVDTSGSMSSSVTGNRGSATSQVTCSDVAGLIGATIIRANHSATIIAFDTTATELNINPRDSVMTNAKSMSRHGGGTDISCAIRYCNDHHIKGDMLIIVSDNESWFDGRGEYRRGQSTGSQAEWEKFKKSNPNAKCCCIDIQPNSTTQIKERDDVVNISGFNDQVFNLLADITDGKGKDHFTNTINSIQI